MRLLVCVLGGLVVACARLPPSSPPSSAKATSPPADLSGSPSEAQFAALVIDAFARAGVPGGRYDAGERIVTFAKGTISLPNIHAQYLASTPADRARLLAAIVDVQRPHAPITLEEARRASLPIVRSTVYLETNHVPYVALDDLTGVAVALDEPAVMRVVTPDDLARWHTTIQAELAIAVANLTRRHPKVLMAIEHVYVIDDPSYASSYLLDDALIAGLDLPGGAIAFVPDRGTLLVGDAADEVALGKLADTVAEASTTELAWPIHVAPLCRETHGWRACERGPTPRARDELGALLRIARVRSYETQREGTPAGALAPLGLTGDTVPLQTVTPWERGQAPALPLADLVELRDGERVIATVPWARFQAVLGPRLRATVTRPPRWQTDGAFPSDAELAALRAP